MLAYKLWRKEKFNKTTEEVAWHHNMPPGLNTRQDGVMMKIINIATMWNLRLYQTGKHLNCNLYQWKMYTEMYHQVV
jgi:hypothetical protein